MFPVLSHHYVLYTHPKALQRSEEGPVLHILAHPELVVPRSGFPRQAQMTTHHPTRLKLSRLLVPTAHHSD